MNERPRLVILNPTCLEVLDAHRAYLDATGLDWDARPEFLALTPELAESAMREADALIVPALIRNLPSPEHMAAYRRLKVLSIAASGYDWLDVDAATRNGIVVTIAPAREGVEVVADLTFGFMLALARQIPHSDRRIAAGDYSRGMGTSVWGKTLGIIGLGRIGKAVVRRAAGFDMRVLAVGGRASRPPEGGQDARSPVTLVPLGTLLKESDYVSLHVRLNDSTQAMFGPRELALMKPSSFLINTARRELLDDQALVAAINEKRIAGVAVDDPPTNITRELAGLPNVIFAAHHGNRAIEGVHAVFRLAIDNAVQLLSGRVAAATEFVVNPEVYNGTPRLREAT